MRPVTTTPCSFASTSMRSPQACSNHIHRYGRPKGCAVNVITDLPLFWIVTSEIRPFTVIHFPMNGWTARLASTRIFPSHNLMSRSGVSSGPKKMRDGLAAASGKVVGRSAGFGAGPAGVLFSLAFLAVGVLLIIWSLPRDARRWQRRDARLFRVSKSETTSNNQRMGWIAPRMRANPVDPTSYAMISGICLRTRCWRIPFEYSLHQAR
jgi:hypothetical protein